MSIEKDSRCNHQTMEFMRKLSSLMQMCPDLPVLWLSEKPNSKSCSVLGNWIPTEPADVSIEQIACKLVVMGDKWIGSVFIKDEPMLDCPPPFDDSEPTWFEAIVIWIKSPHRREIHANIQD